MIRTRDVIAFLGVLVRRQIHLGEDVHHDILQLRVHFLERPGSGAGCSGSFPAHETATPPRWQLRRGKEHARLLERRGGFQRRGHVRAFADCFHAVAISALAVLR